MGREEIGKEQNTEEDMMEKEERGTERRIDEEKVVKNKDMKVICTQTDKDDMMHYQSTPFDWATDVKESIGPNPIPFVDHAPTTASIISMSGLHPTTSPAKPSTNGCLNL